MARKQIEKLMAEVTKQKTLVEILCQRSEWIEIPYPPSVNHYWGQHGKIKYLTKKAKQFRADIAVAVRGIETVEHDVHLIIDVRPPDRRKRDIDNIIKPLMDALEHAGVYVNDCQVARLSVQRGPISKGGQAFIRIEKI